MLLTPFKKDKFIVYTGIVIMLCILAIVLFVSDVYAGRCILAVLVLMPLLLTFISNKAVDRPVKMFTPFPVRLNGTWCFVYYLVEGTDMISPSEMLHRKLTK